MKKFLIVAAAAGIIGGAPMLAQASPHDDLVAFRAFFHKRFPTVKFADYKDGIYAVPAGQVRRSAWEDFISFAPPYEDAVAIGKKLYNTPFANGKTYASCFPNGGLGIKQNYPYFDASTGQIVTFEGAINACRVQNGEKPYPWGKGKLAAVSAYMGSTANGKKIDVKVPNDPRALAWYERGKRHFYSKRGQLNFSCADCHVYNSGEHIRGEVVSPALGHTTHFPVWRKKWAAGAGENPLGGLGTIERRYTGCNKQVRQKPFKIQSDEYKALEYFETYMSDGLEVNTPSLRQ